MLTLKQIVLNLKLLVIKVTTCKQRSTCILTSMQMLNHFNCNDLQKATEAKDSCD
jgi:hypothetical protein